MPATIMKETSASDDSERLNNGQSRAARTSTIIGAHIGRTRVACARRPKSVSEKVHQEKAWRTSNKFRVHGTGAAAGGRTVRVEGGGRAGQAVGSEKG